MARHANVAMNIVGLECFDELKLAIVPLQSYETRNGLARMVQSSKVNIGRSYLFVLLVILAIVPDRRQTKGLNVEPFASECES